MFTWIIGSFLLCISLGYLAFGYRPTTGSELIEALFLAAVVIFLGAFVRVVGNQLRQVAQRAGEQDHEEDEAREGQPQRSRIRS